MPGRHINRAVAAGAAAVMALATVPIATSASTGWSIVPTPNLTFPTGGFTGVSCPTSTWCMAIGGYADPSGAARMMSETWSGSAWALQATPPTPVGATSAGLVAVSCTAPTACTAVGTYVTAPAASPRPFAERWNGAYWSIQSMPSVPLSAVYLGGVSCASPTFCMAVGASTDTVAGSTLTLTERWNGSAWAIQPTIPLPNSALSGVSCVSASACMAVGAYGTLDPTGGFLGTVTGTLAEHWDGVAWVVQPTADFVQSGDSLTSVSCASATSCVAVGEGTGFRATVAVAEHWNGRVWTADQLPPFSPYASSGLASVSCGVVGSCMAVGFGNPLSCGQTCSGTMALSWNGSTWTPQQTGLPSAGLSSVSCTSASACTAVGTGINAVAERWNGTSWAAQAAVNPIGTSYQGLSSISCPTATSCIAVGSGFNGSGPPLFAERWNGTAWAIDPMPTPVGGPYAILKVTGVSCSAPTACTAVGSFGSTWAERWDGISWSIQGNVSPAGFSYVTVSGVSCTDATTCTAVGSYYNSSTAHGTLAERWNGTSWSVQPTPNPPGSGRFTGVSCTSATACSAVGQTAASGFQATLAEHWDGTRWVIEPTPQANNHDQFLDAISCTSDAACTAVGEDGSGQLLAERWDGTAWRMQTVPSPTPSTLLPSTTAAQFNAVSCSAATVCTAVGDIRYGRSIFAERWDGTSWSVQSIPQPVGYLYLQPTLDGVSCPSLTTCMAAGAFNNTGARVTLVERYSG